VAYIPDWEPLADVLVMATGITEDEAKADLCRAVADRKIDVRVRIGSSHSKGGRFFSNGNVGIPSHLRPGDLDWEQSCPLKPWSIGPRLGEHYVWIGGWETVPIDLIELATADVARVLCDANCPNEIRAQNLTRDQHHHPRHQRWSPKLDRALEAINECYPDGIPNQSDEPNVNLCRKVGEKIAELARRKGLDPGKLVVGDDTILRAARRRK
jgi:hypothetical protein